MNPSLAELRDIHLPDAASWWPLATAWWIVITLIVALLVAAFLFFRYWKKHRYNRKLALAELKTIASDNNNDQFLRHIAELVKKTALVKKPNTAAMTGAQWQHFLSQHMSNDIAQLLALARYQPTADYDKAAVINAVQHWIRSH